MARAVVVTDKQADALTALNRVGCASATDFDRDALEQCVNRGYVTKGQNGRGVTYTINGAGKALLKSLGAIR